MTAIPLHRPVRRHLTAHYLIDTIAATMALAVYGYLFGYALLGMAGWL